MPYKGDMVDHFDAPQGKSAADVAREAASFAGHTLAAVLILFTMVLVFALAHTDPDAVDPKLLATGLAFVVPLIGGFILTKVRQDKTARYVWVSGLLTFSIVCVWYSTCLPEAACVNAAEPPKS